MPSLLVIWIAKLSAALSKRLGRGEASALPGLVAERLHSNILEHFGRQLSQGSVLVTGTNGKTTTTRMIAAALSSDEQTLLVNRSGSNLSRSLVSSFILASDWRGRVSADMAVFEVDEAAFPEVFEALKPKAVVILNLFRDQLDRYGELNTLASKLQQALKGTKAKVVLNADDPLIAWLGHDLPNATYFGLRQASVKKLDHDYAADSTACPVCGRALIYQEIFYAHVGIYSCSKKHFKRPQPIVVGSTTRVTLNQSQTTLEIDGKTHQLNLELPGLYNVYNAMAAITMASQLGHDVTEIIKSVESSPAAFGRAETIRINDRQLQIFLVKNPTGFNQVIQAYGAEPKASPLLILVNDLIADGRDVSWLWDVAFEDMPESPVVVVGGTRVYDLALRLKYAGVEAQAQASLNEAMKAFVESIPEGGKGIVLPTYTAMLELRKELSKQTELVGMDQ